MTDNDEPITVTRGELRALTAVVKRAAAMRDLHLTDRDPKRNPYGYAAYRTACVILGESTDERT